MLTVVRVKSTWTKDDNDICKNIRWSTLGEFGIEASIRNSFTEISEEVFNDLMSIFQILDAVEYLDCFIQELKKKALTFLNVCLFETKIIIYKIHFLSYNITNYINELP